MEHIYKTKYKIEKGSWSKEEALKLSEKGWGFCDAVLLSSLIYPEDGSFSCLFEPIDGRTENKDLSDNEMFKVWSMLTSRLSKSKTLPEQKRLLCELVFEKFKEIFYVGKSCDCGVCSISRQKEFDA